MHVIYFSLSLPNFEFYVTESHIRNRFWIWKTKLFKMKQKTIDLLLDCYIKERIPNANHILAEESPKDVPAVKEFPMSFGFAPIKCHYNIGNMMQSGPLKLESAEGPPILCQQQDLSSTDVTDGLSMEEMEKCREIAQRLVVIADQFQKDRTDSRHGRSPNTISDESGIGYSPDEQSALEQIYSAGISQGVSRIASTLTKCFTPQTLKAAIRYLSSGQNDDVSQQLAITFELSTQVVRLMGGRVIGTIRTVLAETFMDQAELEDL